MYGLQDPYLARHCHYQLYKQLPEIPILMEHSFYTDVLHHLWLLVYFEYKLIDCNNSYKIVGSLKVSSLETECFKS